MIEPNKVVRERFKEFIDTYPEGTTKVKAGNCMSLMQWAYDEGYSEAEQDMRDEYREER